MELEFTHRRLLKAKLDAFRAENRKLLHDCEVTELFGEVQEEIDYWLEKAEEADAEREYDRHQGNRLSGDQLATPGRM